MQINKNALALALTAALVAQAHAESPPSPAFHDAAATRQAKPHFRFPAHSHVASSTVLYDQSGVSHGIAPAQDFQAPFDAYDSEGADDFVVTDAAGWTVSAFNFQVSFVFSSSPADPLYEVSVYDDENGSPGASVCEYDALTGDLDASRTSLSVALTTPCELPAGSYWVGLSASLVFPPKMFWMAGPGSALGNIAEWRQPNDGDGTGCTDWAPMSTCTTPGNSTVGSGDLNLLFQVIGAVGTGGGGADCGVGELCLVSTVGTDLTPGTCASTQTIDATVGDQLNFCYTVTNHTGIALDYQSLQNNVDGALFTLTNEPLADGATQQFNRIDTVGQSNTYTSTWTGQDIAPGYVGEIESGSDCSDDIFANGFDDLGACAGGNFIDITQTGTALGLGDEGTVDVPMPFSFNFYGTTSNLVSISNNGGILFASGWGLSFLNESLPSVVVVPPAIMPLWDDFSSTQGDVYYETRGTAPNRQFIVEWFDRAHVSGPANTDGATFELILGEDGAIQFEYDDVAYSGFNNFEGDADDCTSGVCATIGLQDSMTLFNQFSAFAAAVADHSGIRWTVATPQVYTATDSVVVNVGAPQIVIDPSPLTGTVAAGASTTIPFAVENHGDRDLVWTLAEAGPANPHFPPPGTRFSMPFDDPAKASAGPIPAALRRPNIGKPQSPSFHVPFSGGVPVFAFDVSQLQFETFDGLASSTVDVVASTDYTWWTGGAFVEGDFSKFYVLGGSSFIPPDNADILATINTATGVQTTIGTANSDGYGWNGMAYDSTSGTMYAVAGCGSSSHLYTIDVHTGAATPVGTLPNESCTIAIAIDAGGNMYGFDIAADALFAIDKTTGADALIGSIGFNADYLQDMAFDLSTGILYLAGFDADATTDSMYTVDVTTGLASIISPIGATLGEVDAMGIETIGGPCGQEQDLPWLSLSTSSGTTPAGGSSPVTASIDASGASAGDTLSGTVCAHSNDPGQPNRVLPTPITVDVN